MKVRFKDYKHIDSGENGECKFYESMWCFSVDGKEYCWLVRNEECWVKDKSGKNKFEWNILVRDKNDNNRVIWDDRKDESIKEMFNDKKSIKDFITYLDDELTPYDIYLLNGNVNEMDLYSKNIELL